MIIVSHEASIMPHNPLPKKTLRISSGSIYPGKTCTVAEFPVEDYDTYYLSSVSPTQQFLAKYPTLEVTPVVMIAPYLIESVPQLLTTLRTYHPEALI
jgi:hypothetical protein